MDILIKNIEIPKEKYIRVEIHHDGSMYVQKNGYYSFYVKSQDKAIELPPHGRLIDADAIISKIERAVHPDDLTYTIAYGILKQIVEDAETIVEATE